jgi:hypothetical protein
MFLLEEITVRKPYDDDEVVDDEGAEEVGKRLY